MLSNVDVFRDVMSTFCGKDFDICVIDLVFCYPNISHEIRRRNIDFRDELIRRFGLRKQDSSVQRDRPCKWTIEIICNEIVDHVIDFNKNFKSRLESHGFVFVCLDNDIPPHQQALLKCSYVYSDFFPFDASCMNTNYERIFNYLEETQPRTISQYRSKTHDNLYPLMLHVNSISSGLLFNYYYSYLNRQITSTNNIFLKFTFTKDINREAFPPTISVTFNTLVEDIYLEKSPSTVTSNNVISIQSNLLKFTFDPAAYQAFDGIQTAVTFASIGVCDFGITVETMCIWQEKLDLDVLSLIQLKDDVRGWNEDYRPSSSIDRENEQTIGTFEKYSDSSNRCHFFSIGDMPVPSDGHAGISTMKKTAKDCYDMYVNDPKNAFTKNGQKIEKILMVPVYYVLMPSSCQCGPADTINPSECDQMSLRGTIIDPNISDRIQLAYADSNVLRSRPMIHYNRYLRRTFYYVDELDDNQNIIRYLFSAEYPYILSILDQLEKSGQISKAQKRDEYLRFCNMLHRLVQLDNLSQSIKLIEFNDEENQYDLNFDKPNQIGYADFKPLWYQIKEDIDRWYQRSDDYTSSITIESKICPLEDHKHVILFFTGTADTDQSIMTLISDLKEKLKICGYIIDDVEGNLNFIETEKQMIFICTGSANDYINRQIMDAVQYKMNKYGVLRDVFILVNDAIQNFPSRFILSVPYLTFDLQVRSAQLEDNEVKEIILYLNNMNVLSKIYTDVFEDTNHPLAKSPLQCTSVGVGCASAFYFNYAKLLSPLPDHQFRVESINEQLHKENLIDNKSIFISKWVFVIPWTIKNTREILPHAASLNRDEQNAIGFQLSLWKPVDPNFVNPTLSVTVGGVFQRSYSPLITYKLSNLVDGKTFYFPMEIPAALHGLQTQYENIRSHFNFGSFDPLEQATIFRSKIEEFSSKDPDDSWHENILLVPLDKPQTPIEIDSITNFEQAQILLRTLWQKLYSSIQNN